MRRRKTRNKRNKTKDMKRHFRVRCLQRLGENVSETEMLEIVDLIQKQEGTFVETQSHRISVWDVLFRSKTIRVIYDKTRKSVVTVLGEVKNSEKGGKA